MSYLKTNPNSNQLLNQTIQIQNYELSILENHGSMSISYNTENNMYEYSPNLGTDTIVSLYSTDDILYHYFGDDTQKVINNGDVFVISTNSGYDIISYRGQLLAYGATGNKTI